ncbi:mannose-1-phosphate guanylyltransferase/mannose-6-phosphate isomerase [Thiohalorhabdus methylotrophus]|uniref:mannose-1-phosphate guanylyltransferase n=1 Tax=Thiohalorhabdus methylotrophus TaxID=3242694 RepID=A0ABV4TY21_9GAMM
MAAEKVVPVLLSGGVGSRLWPLSRELYPKQFMALTGEGTLLQETYRRVAALEGLSNPVAVCHEDHRFLVAEQLHQAGAAESSVLLEPKGRNTAPAVAVAALEAMVREEDPLILVMPADHLMEQPEQFVKSIRMGRERAAAGGLVTFGVPPTVPETGYGYIRARSLDGVGGPAEVAQFVEKPDQATAVEFLNSGDYLWNSGIFLFRASRYLEELGIHAPEVLEASRRAHSEAVRDLDFLRLDADAFGESPSNSVDYAVMEHTDSAYVVPMEAGWSDVGSWSALYDCGPRDEDGNLLLGDVLSHDSRNNYIRSENRLVATVGLEDHLVVETSDAVLVAPRGRAQEIKGLVEELRESGREEALNHRRVLRPWGSYETITVAERFQVKHLLVNPGCSLSMQLHHHRAEHWVVVRGTARVSRDGEEFLLTEDQSTYIPIGTRHRILNPGAIALELIEVQTGSYLGEDDIVRFQDEYNRE